MTSSERVALLTLPHEPYYTGFIRERKLFKARAYASSVRKAKGWPSADKVLCPWLWFDYSARRHPFNPLDPEFPGPQSGVKREPLLKVVVKP